MRWYSLNSNPLNFTFQKEKMTILDDIFKRCYEEHEKCVDDAEQNSKGLIRKIEIDTCLYSERACLFNEISSQEALNQVSLLYL